MQGEQVHCNCDFGTANHVEMKRAAFEMSDMRHVLHDLPHITPHNSHTWWLIANYF